MSAQDYFHEQWRACDIMDDVSEFLTGKIAALNEIHKTIARDNQTQYSHTMRGLRDYINDMYYLIEDHVELYEDMDTMSGRDGR